MYVHVCTCNMHTTCYVCVMHLLLYVFYRHKMETKSSWELSIPTGLHHRLKDHVIVSRPSTRYDSTSGYKAVYLENGVSLSEPFAFQQFT